MRTLQPALRATAVRDPRTVVWIDSASLEDLVTDRIRAAHDESERRLIAHVREQAQGAGAAALGLFEVVGAPNQAHVAHLIYDPLIRYQGSIGHDGSLYAEGETAPTFGRPPTSGSPNESSSVHSRPAPLTPVEGAASYGLAEASGIAAALRW